MSNRFFLCYREDSADFAKHLSEHINKNQEVYGGAYYSDYHAHGNYLSMEEIGKIFDEVEYFVCCAGRDIVKGFFLPSGEFNRECATALEFVSAEKRRQQGRIKFIIVNYNNYEFTTEDLAVVEKLYAEFGILREDSVDAIKNANRNYYDKRQTDTEMFYNRLLKGLALVKQESQEDVIKKLIEERIAQMMGASIPVPSVDTSEIERLKKENEALKRKLTVNEVKKPIENSFAEEETEVYKFDTFNMPREEAPTYSTPCDYEEPPCSLLKVSEKKNVDYEALEAHVSNVIEKMLESYSVPGKVVKVTRCAQFTQYEISLNTGIPINRFKNLKNDFQLMLSARALRIIAPIPGKSTVALEIPNGESDVVELSEIVNSKSFKKCEGGVQILLGKSTDGVEICDLAKLPHLLISGSAGSGLSTFLDSLIVGTIYKHSPEELKLMLVDVEGLDFVKYKGIPHLLLPEIINRSEHAIAGAKWLTEEIKRRYDLFLATSKRNIDDYNASSKKAMKLPRIVFIVNEMGTITDATKAWQEAIQKIGQLGRGAGVHLIITTHKPSVNVITGMMKVNIPARIAFNTITAIDSRTILDEVGAESLLGKGDMLFSDGHGLGLKRVQGAYVTDSEIESVCRYVIENNECSPDVELWGKIASDRETEVLLYKAMREFLNQKTASVSLLQRKLSMGYMKASKCMDELEKRGFIERNIKDGSYKILITKADFKKFFC